MNLLGLVAKVIRSPRQLTRAFPIRALLRDPDLYHSAGAWTYGRAPRVPISEFLPSTRLADITISRFLERRSHGAPTISELVILCAIVKAEGGRQVLEIGTFDGGTTLSLAHNVSDGGVVTTVDLPQDYSAEGITNVTDPRVVGTRFHGQPIESRIRQIYGDSTKLDWRSLGAPFDVIFIDACHAYDYVKRDTEQAYNAIKANGLIIWHDYGIIEDVSRAVDELAPKAVVLLGTSLAVLRVGQ